MFAQIVAEISVRAQSGLRVIGKMEITLAHIPPAL
jgi:hypothetical protein